MKTIVDNATKCLGTTFAGLFLRGFAAGDLYRTGSLNSISVDLVTMGAALISGRIPTNFRGQEPN